MSANGFAAWSGRGSRLCGSRASRYAGASRGVVGARWVFPRGLHAAHGPVIAAGGRIAVASSDALVVFRPDLSTPEVHSLPRVFDLAAGRDGRIYVVTSEDVRVLTADGSWHTIDLSAPFQGRPPLRLQTSEQGELFAERSGAYACFAPDGTLRWHGDVQQDFRWAGSFRMSLGPGGERACGMALSWSSDDDPTEYYGTLLAWSRDGVPLFRRDHDEDRLPTSTGFDLQVMALRDGVLLAESGAVYYDWTGTEVWRESGFQATCFVALPASGWVYLRDHRQVVRVRVPSPAEARPPASELLLGLGANDFMVDLAGDVQGHLVVAERNTLIGLDASGKIRFRTLVHGIQSVAVGDGYALVVQQPWAIVRVD